MTEAATVLYCHCAYARVVPEQTGRAVLAALRGSGVAFEAVADLCELAARRDPALKRIASSRPVRIAACYARAVRWLFAAGGAPLPGEGVEVANMRTQPAEEVVRSLLGEAAEAVAGTAEGVEAAEAPATGDWIPWFPVIDYDRCKGCRQCSNFCLFGVYELGEDGSVRVENPTRCKTNCPACARICPEAAIIFPKYSAGPINGDEVRPADLQRPEMKVNVKQLLAGDVYQALRARNQPGGTAGGEELDEQKALEERTKCSSATGPAQNVIPLEALLSSPILKRIRGDGEDPQARQQHAARGQGDPDDEQDDASK